MDIGLLGTGMVGRTLGAKFASLGHSVVVGTRDVTSLQDRNADFAEWHRAHPDVSVGTFAEAADHGALVCNATSGTASLDALAAAGADNLAGKILIDTANPLDFSRGMPPTLSVANTDSLGEQIQRAFPDARVVKTLNTVNAGVMVDPASVGGAEHDLFICGNDAAAKAAVETMLRDWFGWRSILDLGDISGARGMEMYLPLWLRLMNALGSPMFSIKVVHSARPAQE